MKKIPEEVPQKSRNFYMKFNEKNMLKVSGRIIRGTFQRILHRIFRRIGRESSPRNPREISEEFHRKSTGKFPKLLLNKIPEEVLEKNVNNFHIEFPKNFSVDSTNWLLKES